MTAIALITGANKGIGYATARILGSQGWTVLVGARDESRGRHAARELAGEGADVRFVELDVTDEESVANAASWIDAEFGLLDVLINNAGIARDDGSGKPSETTIATMRTVYDTNVFGVVAVTNAMLPLLRRAALVAREVDQPCVRRLEAAVFEVERAQVIFEVDVKPLTADSACFFRRTGHETGSNTLALGRRSDRRVKDERM